MKICEHGVVITPEGSRSTRAATCLNCHAAFLADAARRSYANRQEMNEEEREAFLEYHRQYGMQNRAAQSARRRLWRATRRLIEAIGTGDDVAIQKRRFELAKVNEIINVFGAW
jgi:hypothetical protein